MSEYELVDLFLSQPGLLITYFVGFISATSALLVVAHIAGKSIPTSLARVAISIYTITALFLVASFHRIGAVLAAIRGEIGGSLAWHPVASEQQWILPSLTTAGLVAMGAIYQCALVFSACVQCGSCWRLVAC